MLLSQSEDIQGVNSWNQPYLACYTMQSVVLLAMDKGNGPIKFRVYPLSPISSDCMQRMSDWSIATPCKRAFVTQSPTHPRTDESRYHIDHQYHAQRCQSARRDHLAMPQFKAGAIFETRETRIRMPHDEREHARVQANFREWESHARASQKAS